MCAREWPFLLALACAAISVCLPSIAAQMTSINAAIEGRHDQDRGVLYSCACAPTALGFNISKTGSSAQLYIHIPTSSITAPKPKPKINIKKTRENALYTPPSSVIDTDIDNNGAIIINPAQAQVVESTRTCRKRRSQPAAIENATNKTHELPRCRGMTTPRAPRRTFTAA